MVKHLKNTWTLTSMLLCRQTETIKIIWDVYKSHKITINGKVSSDKEFKDTSCLKWIDYIKLKLIKKWQFDN